MMASSGCRRAESRRSTDEANDRLHFPATYRETEGDPESACSCPHPAAAPLHPCSGNVPPRGTWDSHHHLRPTSHCACDRHWAVPDEPDTCDRTTGLISRQYSSNHPSPCLISSSWSWDFVSELWQFMTRLSGRRRRPRRGLQYFKCSSWTARMTSFLHVIIMTLCLLTHISDACSSRSTPKPRPPSPTLRPNITIQTYTCPPEYDAHYCLNGATCFTVKIGESILYNCECSDGYMGQRCEFKDLEGSYLPSKHRAMLEQAGLTSGAVIVVILVVIICFYIYVRSRRKSRYGGRSEDAVDHRGADEEVAPPKKEPRPFSGSYPQGAHAQP